MVLLITDLIILALLVFILVRYLPRLIKIGDTLVNTADQYRFSLQENKNMGRLSLVTNQLETYLKLLAQLEKIDGTEQIQQELKQKIEVLFKEVNDFKL